MIHVEKWILIICKTVKLIQEEATMEVWAEVREGSAVSEQLSAIYVSGWLAVCCRMARPVVPYYFQQRAATDALR